MSSFPSASLATNSNLFGPPPPPFRPYDPLNPNPLIQVSEGSTVEHFKLMSKGTVEEMRLLGCQIIESGIKLLKMSHASLYTAQILFNQFYARESFLNFPLIDILMACVFVAGKVEECIRRARDIVNVFHHIYCLIRKLPAGPIDYVGDVYYIWRDRLCTAESLLLRELGFHVQPASPVNLLLSYLKILELDQQQILEETSVPQTALNFLNDALKTEVYIRFQPRIIAVASISLALDRLNQNNSLLPDPKSLQAPWYALFDVNETELKECRQIIMTIYNRELDTLLPLTKEELSIFSSSIRPKEEEIVNVRSADDRNRDLRESSNRESRDYRVHEERKDYSSHSHGHRERDSRDHRDHKDHSSTHSQLHSHSHSKSHSHSSSSSHNQYNSRH